MSQNGHKIPVMIPQGAIVEVEDGPLNGSRLVDIQWEGQTLMVFTTDLQQRGARIDGGGYVVGRTASPLRFFSCASFEQECQVQT